MARRHRVAGRSGQREREENDPPTRDGNAETMANLKQFVHEMKKSRGRAVEMRLAVLVSVAVALKVFYSERLITSSVAHSVFFFLLIAIVIIVLTTWLDYFPSRLKSIKMRPAGGQGLPLSCLFPPLICTAVMCCIADHRHELLGLLSLYLVLCCTVTLAMLLPTVLYSAPYPNSIVVYNLLLFLLIFIINGVLRTPLFPLLTHSILFSLLVPFLIYSFPDSFTLCEVSLISQGVSLLITDCTLVVATKMHWYTLDSSLILDRSDAILFLEFGVTGFVLCCFVFSFCLYKLASTDDKFYIHVWSLLFLQLSFLFAFFVLLPCLQMITGKPPIRWLFRFLLSSKERVYLLLYWLLAVGVAGFIVLAQSIQSSWWVFSLIKSENPSSLWMRKWFHLLALVVYLPGIVLDPTLLSIASALVTVAFMTIELIRLFRIWPLGEPLHQLLIPFTDSRDSGILIVTHTYLLLGFSLPVWLYPLKDIHTVSKLSMYAGVLSLGVGDSIAAVSGTLVGRHKWPGTHKTLEGTIMSVICQFIVAMVIIMCDSGIPQLSHYSWLILGCSIILGAAMEAYTHQIDNLILGAFQFTICIAFL